MPGSTIYGVAQVNAYIKNIFDNDYALREILVRGEVSNCRDTGSGHLYFTIKDETASLSVVMFQGKRYNGLKFKLENGQKILVSGSISIYEKTGNYQLYANSITLDGIGDLYKKFEETKKRLEEMGMFSDEYKKPIPKFAKKIGIVTASTGAAITDIVNVSTRRNPFVQLILCPAIVQGEMAAPSIVRGIEKLDNMDLDVLIVGRGGGSIEDLWAFNEEIVAKAIFDASTPIISAVGHERDFTIADFVSDLRAPTPSAAAELAVFDANRFLMDVEGLKERLHRHMIGSLENAKLALLASSKDLESKNPKVSLQTRREQLKSIDEKLKALISFNLNETKNKLKLSATTLDAHNPLTKLKGGYGYVKGASGKAIKTIKDIKIGDEFEVVLADGNISSKALDIKENDNGRKK